MKKLTALLVLISLTGCATTRGRVLVGSTLGAVTFGTTATFLSPNQESRSLNAIVFGLIGAVFGGGIGLLTAPDHGAGEARSSLKDKELNSNTPNLITVPLSPDLPEFLKGRLQAPVIEEFVEKDTVSEDGTLHEPHRVYRIQRNAELYAEPTVVSKPTTGKGKR